MDNASNNNWLSLLRRKIQKKFKRNRQKANNNSENVVVEESTQENNNLENIPQIQENTAEIDNANKNCDELRKELYKLNCYWPNLSRADAQKILSNKQNGSFLIRDSSTEKTSFTLSFRANSKTFHCRNQFDVLTKETNNHSLIDIIEDTVKKSQSSVVGFVKCDNSDLLPIAVRLIYPICRENNVPSLQNLCLRLLVSNVNKSNINSLPLPPKIKEYVRTAYNTL